ncbi:MAG: hypothetical protein GY861_05730 [bacterium]|nr:hypothetical protein [bacterium]
MLEELKEIERRLRKHGDNEELHADARIAYLKATIAVADVRLLLLKKTKVYLDKELEKHDNPDNNSNRDNSNSPDNSNSTNNRDNIG